MNRLFLIFFLLFALTASYSHGKTSGMPSPQIGATEDDGRLYCDSLYQKANKVSVRKNIGGYFLMGLAVPFVIVGPNIGPSSAASKNVLQESWNTSRGSLLTAMGVGLAAIGYGLVQSSYRSADLSRDLVLVLGDSTAVGPKARFLCSQAHAKWLENRKTDRYLEGVGGNAGGSSEGKPDKQ